jgi:large subunit ribosomal protein L13
MRTYMAKPGEIARDWYVVDAAGLTLGRLATRIAIVLRGKHKPQFTPHVDAGDFVVVVNADKIELSGEKLDTKKYYRYSGFPGGLKTTVARTLRASNPDRMLREAVKGMLPKNRLASQLLTKLKVYAGNEHPHAAQKPAALPEV